MLMCLFKMDFNANIKIGVVFGVPVKHEALILR